MSLLTFTVDGVDVLARNLRILSEDITSLKSEMQQVGSLIKTSAVANIDRQGSESGGSWKPLSPMTVRMRQKRAGYYAASSSSGPRAPILVWTGNLKKSFRHQADDSSVVIDNTAEYYRDHQAMTRSKPNLPRRLMLEMSQANKVKTLSIIAAGLNKKLDGGNF